MKRWQKIIVIAVVFLGLLVYGYLWVQRIWIAPYFPTKTEKLSELNLYLYSFQPIVLWSFQDNGNQYLKTVYLTRWGLPMMVDVWVFGNYAGENLGWIEYEEGDQKYVKLENFEQMKDRMKFGGRVRLYFVTGEKFVYLPLPDRQEMKVCKYFPRTCIVADIAMEYANEYKYFRTSGFMMNNKKLPALSIGEKLVL